MPPCMPPSFVMSLCTVIVSRARAVTPFYEFKSSDVLVGNRFNAFFSNQLTCIAEYERRGLSCRGVLYNRADRLCGMYGHATATTTYLSQSDGIFYDRVRSPRFVVLLLIEAFF